MNVRSTAWCAAVLLLTLLCVQPALGIPDSMSYEQYVTLIHDQDSQGGCIGYPALHVLEIQKEMETPYSPDPSYAFLNYVFQSSTQNGADPRVLHNPNESWDSILTNYGLPPETSYGTNFDLLGQDVSTMLAHPPSQTAFSEAQAYRVESGLTSGYDPSYEVWKPTYAQAEEWLATKGPLVCQGLYPGHAVALIGYDHTLQKFTIVDSANWVGIDHAGIKQVSYTYFASRQPNMSLEYAPNRPTPLVHPYTARIRIHHEDRRSQLTVRIGAQGHEPLTVWDRNNRVNYTDPGTDLAIDVPLPAYAAEHWPPSDQNPWYVNVTNHDPDHTAVLQEITLVKRLEHPLPIPVRLRRLYPEGPGSLHGEPGTGPEPAYRTVCRHLNRYCDRFSNRVALGLRRRPDLDHEISEPLLCQPRELHGDAHRHVPGRGHAVDHQAGAGQGLPVPARRLHRQFADRVRSIHGPVHGHLDRKPDQLALGLRGRGDLHGAEPDAHV